MFDFQEFVQNQIDNGLGEEEQTHEAYTIYVAEWQADMRDEMLEG
jgi:hypothetical protein